MIVRGHTTHSSQALEAVRSPVHLRLESAHGHAHGWNLREGRGGGCQAALLVA